MDKIRSDDAEPGGGIELQTLCCLLVLFRRGVAFPEREAIPLVLLSEGMYCQKRTEAGKTCKTTVKLLILRPRVAPRRPREAHRWSYKPFVDAS